MTGNIHQYEILKLIGKGTYGKVYKARHISTGQIVAIKSINLEKDENLLHLHLVMVAREIQALYRLSQMENNEFTVRLLDAFVNQEAQVDSK